MVLGTRQSRSSERYVSLPTYLLVSYLHHLLCQGNVLPVSTACSLHLLVDNTVNAIRTMVNATVHLGGEALTV